MLREIFMMFRWKRILNWGCGIVLDINGCVIVRIERECVEMFGMIVGVEELLWLIFF